MVIKYELNQKMLVTLYEVLRNYAKQAAANFYLHCSLKCVRHERWTAGDYSVPSVDYNLGSFMVSMYIIFQKL